MDEIYPFPFRHELVHVLGKVVISELMAIEVGGELVGKSRQLFHYPCHVDAVVVEVGGEIELRTGSQVFAEVTP